MKILDFFLGSRLGGLAAGGLMLAMLLVFWQVDRASQRAIGRTAGELETTQKVEKNNDQVIKRAARVRSKSRNRQVSGQRDPNY